MLNRRCSAVIAVTVVAGACTGGGERPQRSQGPITVADVGFRTPESVLHDPVADVYLVSNINGSSFAKDDNGFISRLSPAGDVLELKWIDGADAEVALDAPKGMAISGDTLFVTDIDVVRLLDRMTGAPLGSREVPGSTFLDDIAVGPSGTVYVTDSGLRAGEGGMVPSGTDAVYKFDEDGQPVALVQGEALGGPSGIAVDGARIIVVTFRTGRILLVDRESGQISGLPSPQQGRLDGIARIGEGTFLISSWEAEAVYLMGAAAQYTVAVDSLPSPADIGYDASRRRVLIPLFTADRVEIRPVRP